MARTSYTREEHAAAHMLHEEFRWLPGGDRRAWSALTLKERIAWLDLARRARTI